MRGEFLFVCIYICQAREVIGVCIRRRRLSLLLSSRCARRLEYAWMEIGGRKKCVQIKLIIKLHTAELVLLQKGKFRDGICALGRERDREREREPDDGEPFV